MGLRTRILRHPALREFYRNYRVLLTFRGFLLAAAATTLYLLIANTLGLEQLQELEQVQDEPLPGVRRHPRLVGRVTRRRVEVVRPLLMISPPAPSMSNASALRQRAVAAAEHNVPPPPPPKPPPAHGLSSTLPAGESGLLPAECAALRSTLNESTAPSTTRPAVLLLTSAWGLQPDAPSSVRVHAGGAAHAVAGAASRSLLLASARRNLRNPSVAALHIFVPPSSCAREWMTREVAASGAHHSTSRLRLHITAAAPSWAALLEHGARHSAAADASLLLVSRADVVWPRDFGCLSPEALHASGAALAPSCAVDLAQCVAAVPRAKRAPTPVTNWTEAYAECRARQKSATACVPLLDLCRKYQRVHHALLVAPPLRLDPHVMSTLRTLAATFGSETRAAAAISAQPGGIVVNPCGELAPVCLRCADFAEISLAWSGTVWSGPHSATGLPPAPLDAALAGSGTCATTAAEQGPGAATPPPPLPVSNVTSHHRSRASAPTARRHVGATQTPKSPPAAVGRRTRVPTVVVGGSSTD